MRRHQQRQEQRIQQHDQYGPADNEASQDGPGLQRDAPRWANGKDESAVRG